MKFSEEKQEIPLFEFINEIKEISGDKLTEEEIFSILKTWVSLISPFN